MPISPGYFFPALPEGLEALAELALDLAWSWSYSTDYLWERIDPELWRQTRNPWFLLQNVGEARLRELASDEEFRETLRDRIWDFRHAQETPGWFQEKYPKPPFGTVAYFCMEFGLGEALPIYSGGLGILAGDHLKTASDLGLPVVGVGLLYQQGYFRQALDVSGIQMEFFPYNDPNFLPVVPVRGQGGEWLRVKIELPGRRLLLRTWVTQVGRTRLYLLDTNDPLNLPADRGITSELYGGGPEIRLQHEMILGIGGWRLLRAMGIHPEVLHLNEGHAAFAVLERAKSYMALSGRSFPEALTVTRAGNLFTTHTPMAAGFDSFDPRMVTKYLGAYADELGIGAQGLLALGREAPENPAEPFSMAWLGVRGSGAVNGVSRLHGEVSRGIFQPVFSRWPRDEVPLDYITNGVHVPTWDSAEADDLWTGACGKSRWLGSLDEVDQRIRALSDEELWDFRGRSRRKLLQNIRERLLRQRIESCALGECAPDAGHPLDPNALTLGFARRFAEYKRPNLLLSDPERLVRLLTDPRRPVQLILAGKAHPEDEPGKAMIGEWVRFSQRPEVRGRVIFLIDYDILLAGFLVQGVDLWINTPRRLWEACGTSGMKVLVNGGLNLSELDGWWAEAYTPEVGWALDDGLTHRDGPEWDAVEAAHLYNLLEGQIVPAFYNHDERGIPTAWVGRMRESMARLTPRFSTNRMVREYTERYYIPQAQAYVRRAAENGKLGVEIEAWRRALARDWSQVRLGSLTIETTAADYAPDSPPDGYLFQIPVCLGGLDPAFVEVELYAEAEAGGAPFRQSMKRVQKLAEVDNSYLYETHLATRRPMSHFTPRIIPRHPEALVPLEASQILWWR